MRTIKFEVISQNKQLDEVAELMSILDLGITGIEGQVKDIYSWKTLKTIDKTYIEKSKSAIKEAIEKSGFRVISIKKIK